MKRFSSEGHPESFTDFHEEEKREEGDRRRRGGIKRGESNLASKQFPMCSPQSGSLKEVHGVTQSREEGGRR